MQKLPTDTDAVPSLPMDPDDLTQVLTTLARLESATIKLAEAIETLGPTPASISTEALAEIIREAAGTIVDEAVIALSAASNSCRNDLSDLAANSKAAAEEITSIFKKAMEDGTSAVKRAVEQSVADNRTALKAALKVDIQNTRAALQASTEAGQTVHEKLGSTAADLETVADQLRYYTPEMSQLAEHRLRIVGRHTGLISSAATVAGVAAVEMLLHALGLR